MGSVASVVGNSDFIVTVDSNDRSDKDGDSLPAALSKVEFKVTHSPKKNKFGDIYGVNIHMLEDFIAEHNIDSSLSTYYVVQKIILPATSTARKSYMDVVLHKKQRFNRSRSIVHTLHRNPVIIRNSNRSSQTNYHTMNDSLFLPQLHLIDPQISAIVAHNWKMPFLTLVDIITNSQPVNHNVGVLRFEKTSTGDPTQETIETNEYKENAYFWIDIFCKNLHVSAMSTKEMDIALDKSGMKYVLV